MDGLNRAHDPRRFVESAVQCVFWYAHIGKLFLMVDGRIVGVNGYIIV